ncbi:MAG: Rrf2 family transcriptional regulator [Bacteroidales bacterium]|nr:Rrf2 family transcriptional regulator [Bacteroidales bacterium]NLO51982.1 Rrf2 family transcriptional regulator [Bacteroidales bacterium]
MSKLFNISEASNIAVHSLAMMANRTEHLSATQLSEALHLSRNHLAKVLQMLARHGLITSTRGPKGGFVLNRPASEISIYDIFVIIDGKPEIDHCRIAEGFCPFDECVFGDVQHKLFDEYKHYYMHRTIEEIALFKEKN